MIPFFGGVHLVTNIIQTWTSWNLSFCLHHWHHSQNVCNFPETQFWTKMLLKIGCKCKIAEVLLAYNIFWLPTARNFCSHKSWRYLPPLKVSGTYVAKMDPTVSLTKANNFSLHSDRKLFWPFTARKIKSQQGTLRTRSSWREMVWPYWTPLGAAHSMRTATFFCFPTTW